MRTIILGSITALAILGGTACESKITGNDGNFTFSYPADDDVFDFNKPIAVGARLDVSVATVGTDLDVVLADASSADPSVLEVVEVSGSTFTVESIGDGNTLIEVKGAEAGGQSATDSVNLLARVPEVHRLFDICTAENPAYLESSVAWLGFEFEMANGQAVIGYGYYPVSFSDPGTALDLSHQGSQLMKLDLGAAGSVTMNSVLTTTSLEITTVTSASLDGIADPIAFVFEDIDVGDVNPFYMRPMSGAHTVCQAFELTYTVTSDTPTLCDVRRIEATASDGSAEGKEGGWFEIEGIAEGDCLYSATYADGSAGAGVTVQFSYPIEP